MYALYTTLIRRDPFAWTSPLNASANKNNSLRPQGFQRTQLSLFVCLFHVLAILLIYPDSLDRIHANKHNCGQREVTPYDDSACLCSSMRIWGEGLGAKRPNISIDVHAAKGFTTSLTYSCEAEESLAIKTETSTRTGFFFYVGAGESFRLSRTQAGESMTSWTSLSLKCYASVCFPNFDYSSSLNRQSVQVLRQSNCRPR